ncbi:SH2 domain-containing protein 1A-like [Heptranchias perlo]|uniref:SH2 domain-containing protein 1A-like n=1 Tax=Heptranchias perlo TaxID=212740 RepID=UPI003559A49E
MGKCLYTSLYRVLLSLRKSGGSANTTHSRKYSKAPHPPHAVKQGRESTLAAQSPSIETMRSPVYHGRISQADTEDLLASSGKYGSYLIRDSETVPGIYCLCVLNQTFVHTYRISETSGTWSVQTSRGVLPRFFSSIEKLIKAYEKPGQGTVVPLLHPVEYETYKIQRQNEGSRGARIGF